MRENEVSFEEKREFSRRLREGILLAQKRLFERKAKLGEEVIVADENGLPVAVSAAEMLRKLVTEHPEI